ncbi:hypothetical protein BLI708_00340 [Bifidobacterium imperatoris]|uniref:Scaffolding protein n=1 Tax=Bifidobacterium imperatoris TaxID=2020965 RepID=A0A2N5IPA7_9BIFI|nr:hypothetical protein [Bifidobacterium imperatoris]PLS23792.1 hypothetical protein Tam1G_2164 [Bifidobacterium imperatoris]QSY57826.1 hypothetical protein BLI708_00340 [Bifidobacterium imperatoris]
MADDANEQNNTPEPPGGQQNTDTGQKPPWERDGEEFSPEKAWNLIQHLREDNSKLKTASEASSAKLREIEDAKLTEQEKLQRDLKETREQLAQVNMAKAWAEARAKYPSLTEQDFDLIGGDNPEEVMDKAAKLAARIDAQAAKDADQNNINPLQRVHAKPSGGTDPTSNPATDWLRDALTSK